MKRLKVYTVRRKRHKGDKGTIYRLFRGSVMLLDIWVEERNGTGPPIINLDRSGIVKAINGETVPSQRNTMPMSLQPYHLIAIGVLAEEYMGEQHWYQHYRAFGETFIWNMVMVDGRTRFNSGELFEAYVRAKQTNRDRRP